MRFIFVFSILFLLVGCPATLRIYIHNKGDSILTYHSNFGPREAVEIRPGRTKYFSARPDLDVCVEIDVDERKVFFLFPRESSFAWRSASYGVRLDTYFQYDRLFVRNETAQWVRVDEAESCDAA
jgi:hypothetical protein